VLRHTLHFSFTDPNGWGRQLQIASCQVNIVLHAVSMVTATHPLPCPLCAACVEITPTAYSEQPCAVCGCGLVLRQSRDAGGQPLAWHFACPCPVCRNVFGPGDEDTSGFLDVLCSPLWRRAVDI
jgi:hypothetical protein